MILDVRSMAYDLEDYNEDFFHRFGLTRVAGLLRESHRKMVPAAGIRLGAPVARPGKIICLGKNYLDHAKEFDNRIPQAPVLFSKAPSALTGPNDPQVFSGDIPVDIEAELAVVIGKTASKVSEPQALEYIAGYTILNDVTDRTAQKKDEQWFRSKSADTFAPLGPWLVTFDEILDVHNLRIRSKLNQETLQDANTSDMIFKIPFLIEYISAEITLFPGDIISTGTPAGVGFARQPPLTLRVGDAVEIEIKKLGRQINKVNSA